MDKLRLLLFTTLFSIFLGCGQQLTPTVLIDDGIRDNRAVGFTDTTVTKVSSRLGSLRDVNEGKLYGLSSDKSQIWIYDESVRTLRTLPIVGEGPNKIGAIHNVYARNDGKFVVHDLRGAYLYNELGQISFACPQLYGEANVGTTASGFVLGGYDVITPSLNPEIPLETENYYGMPGLFFLSRVNLKTCNVSSYGKLPEKSVYGKLNLPVRQRGFVEPVGEDRVLLYFQFDRLIQLLDVNDFTPVSTLALSPENFGEIRGARDRSLQEMTRLAQVNPAYVRMKVTANGKYLITQYTEGNSEYIPTQQYLDGAEERPNRWFEVYDLEENKKIGREFGGMPNGAILIDAPSLDGVYLYTNEMNGEEGTFLIRASIALGPESE